MEISLKESMDLWSCVKDTIFVYSNLVLSRCVGYQLPLLFVRMVGFILGKAVQDRSLHKKRQFKRIIEFQVAIHGCPVIVLFLSISWSAVTPGYVSHQTNWSTNTTQTYLWKEEAFWMSFIFPYPCSFTLFFSILTMEGSNSFYWTLLKGKPSQASKHI